MLATVELVLDALARPEPVDVDRAVRRVEGRIDAARAAAPSAGGSGPTGDGDAHLRHANAALTRLTQPDPDAWREAAGLWQRLSRPWWAAVAVLGEAEAAFAAGAVGERPSACRPPTEWPSWG